MVDSFKVDQDAVLEAGLRFTMRVPTDKFYKTWHPSITYVKTTINLPPLCSFTVCYALHSPSGYYQIILNS